MAVWGTVIDVAMALGQHLVVTVTALEAVIVEGTRPGVNVEDAFQKSLASRRSRNINHFNP